MKLSKLFIVFPPDTDKYNAHQYHRICQSRYFILKNSHILSLFEWFPVQFDKDCLQHVHKIAKRERPPFSSY